VGGAPQSSSSIPRMPVRVMAILNVTPDSFSDGGHLRNRNTVLRAALEAINAGADILDIGGESTRPGAQEISVDEELSRVIAPLVWIRDEFPDISLSIDSRKSRVVAEALSLGVHIVNDVSGLQFDPNMLAVVADSKASLILMHSHGVPETMQQEPDKAEVYRHGILAAVHQFFTEAIAKTNEAGIAGNRLILDPGFGFGKSVAHQLTLLKHLDTFRYPCEAASSITEGSHMIPLLVGTSRKSFMALTAAGEGVKAKDILPPGERDFLTAASMALAIERGAALVRVHNAKAMVPIVRFVERCIVDF